MITIRMDLPGMEKSDIEVLLEDHTLIVKGKRNFLAQTDEEDEGGIKLRRRERQFGSFRRTVQLPQTIERDTIKGRYENGVLTITAPRKKGETKKPRKIEIE